MAGCEWRMEWFAMTQRDEKALEDTLAESLADLVPDAESVSEQEFAEVVGGALEAVGGRLLFKMCVGGEGAQEHVAAAAVGDGKSQQILMMTLPKSGGTLKVEPAAKSGSPAARIADAYAGLMDVFQAAA